MAQQVKIIGFGKAGSNFRPVFIKYLRPPLNQKKKSDAANTITQHQLNCSSHIVKSYLLLLCSVKPPCSCSKKNTNQTPLGGRPIADLNSFSANNPGNRI